MRAASRLEDIIPALTGEPLIRNGGRELLTRCAFHVDGHPSLGINVEKQVWYCHPCDIGGDVFAFVERFKQMPFEEALAWLADRSGLSNGNGHATPTASPSRRPEREHLYVDEHRAPLLKVVIAGRRPDGKKIVWQERPDGHGGWARGTEGARRVLYRLPDLMGQRACLLPEGEQDVDSAWAIGLPATCNLGGAGKWRDEDARMLKAVGIERVVVIPDNDDAGRLHAEAVARSCYDHGLTVRMLVLPDLPPKGDLSDYLATHTKAELHARLAALTEKAAYVPPPMADQIAPCDEDEPPFARLADASWPAPLADAAYLGITGEIVKLLAPHTEADPAALLLQLLAMFGNVIGRTAHFRVEADTHYLSLYVVLVGKTSKGRKGVSEGRVRQFFAPIDSQWATDCQASGLSTGEGLIAAIRDKTEKQEQVKKNGYTVDYQTVVADPGVSDKRLYVTESEFASPLKAIQRDGNTLSPVVRNAWDGKTLRTLTKASPLRATDPHVTILGSITQHEGRRLLNATESANGFGNRFLWVCVQRSQYLPDGGAYVNVDALIERLRDLITRARRVGEMRRDPEARALWHQVYRPLSTGRPGLLGSLTARAEAQVMRLACLYALSDGSDVVRVPHLTAALEVWRYCFDSTAYIFGDSLGDTKADTLLAALKTAGPRGLTRSEITNDVFQKNLSASDLERIVTLLREVGLAVCRHDDSRGGRRAERWFYTRESYGRNGESPLPDAEAGTFSVNAVHPLAGSTGSKASAAFATRVAVEAAGDLFPEPPTGVSGSGPDPDDTPGWEQVRL